MVTLNKPSAGDTDWATEINSNWTTLESNVPKGKFDATAAPTVDDDTGDGYSPGSQWVDVTNDKAYVCLDATSGAAVWKGVDAEAVNPEDYIKGLEVSVTSATVVSIAAGHCRDSTNTYDLTLSAADTANITTSTDRDFTEAASTWYYVWLIADSTGANSPRAFLSSSSSAPTYPTGYDIGRRVGAGRNNSSSNLKLGASKGDGTFRAFMFDLGVLVLSASVQTTEQTLSVATAVPPTGTQAFVGLNLTPTGSVNRGRVYSVAGSSASAYPYSSVWSVNFGAAENGFLLNCISQQLFWLVDLNYAVTTNIRIAGYVDNLNT